MAKKFMTKPPTARQTAAKAAAKAAAALKVAMKKNLDELQSGEVANQIQELIEDSPIESLASRRALAEAAILCRLEIRVLTQKALSQTITAEERRCLPPMINQLNKLLTTLQVIAAKDDDDDEAFM